MQYAKVLETLDRIEAECGCDLPELSDPTPSERAERVLGCDDPPSGPDEVFLRRLIGG